VRQHARETTGLRVLGQARTRGGVVRVDDGVGGHTLGGAGLGPGVDGVHVGNLDELLELADSGEHCAKGDRDQQKARQRLQRSRNDYSRARNALFQPLARRPMSVIRGVLVNILERRTLIRLDTLRDPHNVGHSAQRVSTGPHRQRNGRLTTETPDPHHSAHENTCRHYSKPHGTV